jgi:ribosomal protein S18 acetylase RimI-like enzyme
MFADYAPQQRTEPRPALPVGCVVRPAESHDTAAIARLTSQRSGIALDACVERTERQFRADAAQQNLTVVAEIQGGVIGFGRARDLRRTAIGPFDAPEGWYLLGVIVAPEFRRLGIATELTRVRLRWVADRSHEVFYFANSLNLASIDMHRNLGFVETRRPFAMQGVHFSGGGVGVLFRASLGMAERHLPHSPD